MANNKKIRGLTVEIGGDTTKLGKALDDSKKKSKSLQTELRQVEKLLKMDPGNVELLAQKQKILTDQVDETKKRLSLMKEEQKKVNQLFKNGEIGEADYRKYQREVEQTRIDLEKLEGQLKETGDKFSEVQRKSGAVNFKNAEDKAAHLKGVIKDMADSAVENMEKVSKTAETVGTGLEKAGSVLNKGSAAAAAVLAGSVASFKDLDNGYDIIVKKTGATEEAFDSLKATADEIFSGSVFDMSDIGAAIGEVNTRFGYTDEVLKSVTEQYLQFAKINDADVADSVGKTARIMSAWNLSAKNLPDLLGMITAKGQETGVAVSALMDKVLDNNAIFKEMGLSLEESISLMAQFEKNGINDSTALTALKTSVKNATKEGKSLSEALKDSVSDIKNATTDTEALQKATELFGTKGAAEMANAIRDGRINFDDLSGSMTDYRDTVKKTYDATLDPLEESKQVLNNLKLAGADLAAEALKEGKPLIDDVVKGIKDITQGFKKLSPEQKQAVLNTIKLVAVAGPAVTLGGKAVKGFGDLVGVIPKVVNVIKGMTGATKAAETAQIGLNAAQSASPVGALIALLGLVAAAITTYYLTTDEATRRAAFLTEEEDKLYRRIDENIEKWDELRQTREQASKEIEGQYGYYEGLADRLKAITDESGKIKAGYEEEAKTIVDVLNEAFGKEYEITGGVIKNYQQMQTEINSLIQLQKAQAQQDAFSDSYKEAITNRTQAFTDWQDMKKDVQSIDDRIRELREEYNRFGATGEWVQTTTGRQWKADPKKEQEKAGLLVAIDAEISRRKKAQEETEKAQKQYLEYLNTIKSYEGVTSAIASKDTSAIAEATNMMTNHFVYAENATKAMLEQQLKDSQQSLNDIRSAYENGAPGITQAMVDNAQQLVVRSQAELNKLTPEVKKEVEASTEAVKEQKEPFKSAMGDTLASGRQEFDVHKPDYKEGGKGLAQEAKKGAESIDMGETGGNIVLGMLKGMWNNSIFAKIGETVGNVSKSIYNAFTDWWDMHSPANKHAPFVGKNIVLGVLKKMGSMKREIKATGDEVNEAIYQSLTPDKARLGELLNMDHAIIPPLFDTSYSRGIDRSELIALSSKMDVLIDKMDAIARKEQGIYLDGNILVGRTVERMDNALYNRAVNRERGV